MSARDRATLEANKMNRHIPIKQNDDTRLMMTRISSFTNPLMLGFDELERVLARAAKSSNDGYPPYNIEKVISGESGEETLRITLAVAGFGDEDLDISVEDHQLSIVGKQKDDSHKSYLHRGIASRQFRKSFVLAEGIEVAGANLEKGLLSIELVRIQPERVVRKISIKSKH